MTQEPGRTAVPAAIRGPRGRGEVATRLPAIVPAEPLHYARRIRSAPTAAAAAAFPAPSPTSHTGGIMADVSRDIVSELAPTGTLRAAINFGNSVLAQKDPATGEPRGVSAALARELAKRLGAPISFITFDAAGKVTEAGKTGALGICFLAIAPVRAEGISFTNPYVVIE